MGTENNSLELDKLIELQEQIIQLKIEVTNLQSQMYRQVDQLLDVRDVLAEDKMIQAKILTTLDSLAKLVDVIMSKVNLETVAKEIKEEKKDKKDLVNYIAIAYNISLILLTVYQLYSDFVKHVIGGPTP